MAITDTRPEEAATEASAADGVTGEPGGLVGLLGTGDHKALGRLYIGVSMAFGLAALVGAALSRLENVGDGGILPEDTAFQVFQLSELSLAFLFVIPLFVGIGLLVVPLQVGASTIAFPRAAALSFWTWLAGSITFITAYGLNGGVGGGGQRATELSYLALVLVLVGLMLASVCIATTVVALRTPGMTLDRAPMFSWGMLVASGVWLLTLPVLVANLAVAHLNHHNGGVEFTAVGADDWPLLSWAIILPQVYVVAIPLLGALGDVVPSMAGVRQPWRGVVLSGIGAFGALSIGAWAQPAQGGEVWAEPLFIFVAFAIVVPVLACLGPWAAAIGAGTTKLHAGLAVGMAGMAVLLVAGLTGALFSVEPFQVQSVTLPEYGMPVGALGHSNLVIGAALIGALGAIFYWGPKITGRTLSDGLGKLVAPVALIGALCWGVAPVVQGFQAEFTGLADADDPLTIISVAGAGLLALAVVVTAVALIQASSGPMADDDPWGTGQTLEWATASPPERGNFGTLDPVVSPEPLLDTDDEEAS